MHGQNHIEIKKYVFHWQQILS